MTQPAQTTHKQPTKGYTCKGVDCPALRHAYQANQAPTEPELGDLARRTSLSVQQISDWFRRRRRKDGLSPSWLGCQSGQHDMPTQRPALPRSRPKAKRKLPARRRQKVTKPHSNEALDSDSDSLHVQSHFVPTITPPNPRSFQAQFVHNTPLKPSLPDLSFVARDSSPLRPFNLSPPTRDKIERCESREFSIGPLAIDGGAFLEGTACTVPPIRVPPLPFSDAFTPGPEEATAIAGLMALDPPKLFPAPNEVWPGQEHPVMGISQFLPPMPTARTRLNFDFLPPTLAQFLCLPQYPTTSQEQELTYTLTVTGSQLRNILLSQLIV